MKSRGVLGLLLASGAWALPELAVQRRDRHTHGKTGHVSRGVVKRQAGTVGENIEEIITYTPGGAYYVNVTVGTPGQPQTVILDTGSSDLYFDASSAPACQTTGQYACKGGTFDPSNSHSYSVAVPAPAFDTKFGDGSTAEGPFGEDTVCISDICVDNVQFGVAETVKTTTGFSLGLMGIGYSVNEATRHRYPNIPEVLTDAGEINSRLYSIYLNSEGAMSGSVLFGGIDTTKYTGDLVTFDILPNIIQQGRKQYLTSEVYQFVTTVTGLTTTVSGKTSHIFAGGAPGVSAYNPQGGSLPVLLDTGSTAWSVPTEVYAAIVQQFSYISRRGTCSCSYASSSDTLTLEFGGKLQITVAAQNFIVPLYDPVTADPVPWNADGSEQECVFLIQPSEGTGFGFDTLGDAVIRSMYIVYDLDQGQVSLAQANVDSKASPNIKVVQAGPGGVAEAAGSNYVAASSSQSLSIAAPYSQTASGAAGLPTYSTGRATTTIGMETGANALPADARPTATKSGSALALGPPAARWSAHGSAAWAIGAAVVGGGLFGLAVL